MCLYINSAAKVAEEDIICYKMLEECKLEGYPYKSPFIGHPIRAEIMLGLYPYIGLGEKSIKSKFGEHPFISEGYIHAYKTLFDAEDMCNYCTKYFENHVRLFECKIPAGTEYYDGVDRNSISGYASERIVFVKELF